MLRRLGSLIPKSRTLRWMLVGLVCGPIVVLGLVALGSMLLRVELKIDLAMVGFAVGLTVVALTVSAIVQYRLRPKSALMVGYNYKLIQPLFPMGRYSFSLEVYFEHDVKGERRHSRQALIEMKFKKGDHPDILAWCCAQISGQLAKHGRIAAQRYPQAQIVMGPEPSPEELAAHAEVVEVPESAVEEAVEEAVEPASEPD